MNVESVVPSLNLQTIVNAIPGNYVILLPDAPQFTIIGVTDSFLQTTHKTREQLLGKPLFDAFTDDTSNNEATGVATVRASLNYVIERKEAHQIADQRYDIVNPVTGTFEVKVWSASNTPVLNAEGSLQYIIHTTEDITERVKLQEENNLRRERLEKSESRFRALANASSDVIYRLNADWTIMYPLDGRGFLSDTNAPIKNWMEKNVHPSEHQTVKKTIVAAIAAKSVFELEHRVVTVDGATGWTFSRAVPILDDEDNIVEWFGTASDITARKAIEQSLKESESRFRTLVQEAPVAMFIFRGENMVISTANKMALQMIRRTEEVVGKPLLEALPELTGSTAYQLFQEIYHTGRAQYGQAVLVPLERGGILEDCYFNFAYTPLFENGQVVGVMDVATEVTDLVLARKKIEEVVAQRTKELGEANQALQDSNKELQRSNANLEEFAHAASHDLKEPVRKITFFSDQLKHQLASHLTDVELRSFDRIENATERMGNLIDDLLLYSHVSQRPHQMEKVDLNIKLQRVLDDLELDIEEKGAVINIGSLPVVQGYRRQLQQLFQNLITNALKYSKKDVPPHIEISAEEMEENGERYNVISVKDNGIGFAQEYAEKIFQMFARLHGKNEYSGTGVGLSIAKKVVENHKGLIQVESTVGVGSVFKIYLPVESY